MCRFRDVHHTLKHPALEKFDFKPVRKMVRIIDKAHIITDALMTFLIATRKVYNDFVIYLIIFDTLATFCRQHSSF